MNRSITIHTRFQQRRATAARWAEVNPILREGEIGLETDTHRIKFGDGKTAWNDIPYSTKDLLPANTENLGGIMAEPKGKDYTVEVRIDPETNRLYVPAMPRLAAVATSGDYGDLSNKPAPYRLPAATEAAIGGVAAAPRTTDYTVEVKKDPASHKLYVPTSTDGNVFDGKLPGLVIRVIYEHQARSTHFTNETGAIQNAKIYFRPQCDRDYFNRIMPGLYVGLARCTSRRRQRRQKTAGVSMRNTQWHVVGAPAIIDIPEERYPLKSVFTSGFNLAPRWTYEDVAPVPVSELIQEYSGEWIRFPHDLETIVRRFIYIFQNVAAEEYRVLPIQSLGSTTPILKGYIKISGQRLKTDLEIARTSAREFYASVNLGFCFCRVTTVPKNMERWYFGPLELKRAMVVASPTPNTIHYYLKDPVKKTLIR